MSVSRAYRKRGTWHICSGGRRAVQFVMLRVIRFAAELKVFASYFPQSAMVKSMFLYLFFLTLL